MCSPATHVMLQSFELFPVGGYRCAFGPAAFTSGGASKFSKFLANRFRKSSAALS